MKLETLIETRNLTKQYGERTVLDIDELQVHKDEILVFLGPSGSGKSVLLRLLNLLESPTSGTIEFSGRDAREMNRQERADLAHRMVLLFQDPLLFSTSVYKNIAFGLKIRKYSREEIAAKVDGVLEMVKLEGFREKYPFTLSGGEAQRVALARALVFEPEIIFLDEPFANLDRLNRMSLQREVKKILKEKKLTAIFVTHDMEEAAIMADRIAIINEGKILQVGDPSEIFYRPGSEFAAKFVGMDNIIEGRVRSVEEGLVQIEVDDTVIEAVVEAEAGEAIKVGLRPEDITVIPAGRIDEPSSSRNAITGTVSEIIITGPTAHLAVCCPFPLTAVITRRSLEELELKEGSPVGLRFKATSLAKLDS